MKNNIVWFDGRRGDKLRVLYYSDKGFLGDATLTFMKDGMCDLDLGDCLPALVELNGNPAVMRMTGEIFVPAYYKVDEKDPS